jgi:methylmalonyl-CoA mutase, C-terminal domain
VRAGVGGPVRVLVAKLGLDGHDRGAKVVAHALREAGFEVIYTGLRRTAGQVVRIGADEDVDVIGISILSGASFGLVKQVFDEFERLGPESIRPVVVGGTVSDDDAVKLRALGVADVFPVRTPLDELAPRIRQVLEGQVSSA